MGEARSRQLWAHTSTLLAMLANVHRDPHKTRAYKPAEFNPHVRRTEKLPRVGVTALKQVFVDRVARPPAAHRDE
jgi:hypothetical protein